MSKLVLIKHSLPSIDPGVPAAEWRLAPEGERRSLLLADMLMPYLPAVLVSSPEPKAVATASFVAERVNLSLTTVDGLEEHHRRTAPFASNDLFQQAVQSFFMRPSELVFGEETADAAYNRFAGTLDALLAHDHDSNLLVVTHGTVMSLYLSRHMHLDPFLLWQQLQLPSFVVVDRLSQTIETIKTQIT